MKLKYKIILISVAAFAVWIVAIQFQKFEQPDAKNIDKRLNYLERIIFQPLDANAEILQLKSENYEFMIFTYAYASYALTNLAIKDSTYRMRAEKLIKEAITKSLDSRIYSPYGIDSLIIGSDTLPHYSVLYLGHLNLMMGCYRMVSSDTLFDKLNDKISESLYQRYNRAACMNLESYPSAIWIPDNTVALASLKLHSAVAGSEYDAVCSRWVEYAKSNLIEPETNALYSTINNETGKAKEEPRGSMLGWSIMFIYQFDSEFAIELYQNYKKNFSCEWLIFRLFEERSGKRETSIGDIDSGPIILGYSIPANEFALAGAILSDDLHTARKLERLINLGAATDEDDNELKYDVRFINMNISPMAEAIVLYSMSITRWVAPLPGGEEGEREN